jgi:hypothetical protein
MQDSLLPPLQIEITATPQKPAPKGRCVARVGTASLDWQLDCLARHICKMETKGDRLNFLERSGKKKPPEFLDDLKQRVQREWIKMYGEPRKTGAANGDS